MAVLMLDCPSVYGAGGLGLWWAGGTAHLTTQGATLPPGSQAGALTLSNTSSNGMALSNTYTAVGTKIMACRFYRLPASGGGNLMMPCKNQGFGKVNPCCAIRVDDTGTTITDGFINNGNPNVLAVGPVIPSGEWHHLEAQFVLSTTGTGSVTLYLDGSPTTFMHATGLTMQYATSDCHVFYACQLLTPPDDSSLTGCMPGYITDGYVFDNTGPAPFNSALAPQGYGGFKIGFALPNGPGIISQWTPNGAATIWQCISEVPEDGDTTYASDATIGDQYQCTIGAIPAIQTLLCAQLSVCAREDDAGPRSYQSGFYKGGVYGYSGVDEYLGGSYNYLFDQFPVNPVTGLAWASSDLTGLQIGARVTH